MEKTLVVMAAGMGSRFGGLKQIEPVGPNGEFIIDYSIYDAKRAGFTKVVFVIKKENEKIFKETIGKRLENNIKVEYAFQELTSVPEEITIPSDRTKPLGTGHALYVTKDNVNEPFAVISADDFYGKEPFYLLSEFLDNGNDYGVIGYEIGSTLTENGSVKRGVCFEKDGKLDAIIESKVERINGIIHGEPLDGRPAYTMEENHPVSMLMYGLRPNIYEYIDKDIIEYFNNQDDLSTVEYYLPTVLDDMKNKKLVDIKIIPTKDKWKGITYASDLIEFKEYLNSLIEKEEYPEKLW
ncbi:MAG: nucleotidyltransferase [Firmicutes bacterium]|nr:nucleotidyltransferase [Bacillota bacterium]